MSVTFKEYIKYPVESTHNNKFCQLEKFEKNWNFDFFLGGRLNVIPRIASISPKIYIIYLVAKCLDSGTS